MGKGKSATTQEVGDTLLIMVDDMVGEKYKEVVVSTNKEEFEKELGVEMLNNTELQKHIFRATYKNLKKEKRGNILQSNQDVDLILKNIITNKDYLMIKGSNATGLNIISNAMIKGI